MVLRAMPFHDIQVQEDGDMMISDYPQDSSGCHHVDKSFIGTLYRPDGFSDSIYVCWECGEIVYEQKVEEEIREGRTYDVRKLLGSIVE